MITDSFDNKSPAKINVKKNEHAVRVDAVIFTFSCEIEKYVIPDCHKNSPVLFLANPVRQMPTSFLFKTFL